MDNTIDKLTQIKRFYILGIGRSGTTLLVNILNRNKYVLATPESVFAQFFYASFKNKKSFTKKDIDAVLDFIKVNEKLQPFINWVFNYTFFDTIEYPLQMNYDDFLNLIHLQFIPPEDKEKEIRYIIDKNPGNSIFGSELLNINSASKAIILVRDYRANILSRKEKIHWRSTNTIYNAKRWQLFYTKLFKLNQQYPKKTLFIRYEDLVSNNEANIKKIFNFLDIPFSKEILTPTASILTEKELKEKYNYLSSEHIEVLKNKISAVNKPIYSGRLEKWKENLKPEDIAQCDVICSETGFQFGYEKFKGNTKASTFLKWSTPYFRGKLSIVKQQILFTLPYGIKLWRLKQVVNKATYKK